MVFLTADHGGFELKKEIFVYLRAQGIEVTDLGAFELNPDDDYPDFARLLAKELQKDHRAFGIALCRSGAGVCFTLNKFRGIRAAQAYTAQEAQMLRSDDDANVLCIGADYVPRDQVFLMAGAFLDTALADPQRYARRLSKLGAIEQENFKTP